MLTIPVELNVSPGSIPAVVHVKQFQTDAELQIRLFTTKGTLSIGTLTEKKIRGTKMDGNGYSADVTYTAATQTVTVHLAEQMTAVAGRQPFEIVLTDTSGKMITATFYLDVQKSAMSLETISNSVILELADATGRASEILAAAESIEDYTYPVQELAGYLLNQKSANLMSLASPSATNVREITLQNNRIIQKVTANNPTGTTYYSFLISKEPRYISGTKSGVISSLTAADFTDFNFATDRNLEINTSIVCNSNGGESSKSSYFIIATRNATSGEVKYTTIGDFNVASSNYVAKDQSVQVYDVLPELAQNKNIAIIYVGRYPNVNQNSTISIRQSRTYARLAPISYAHVASQAYKVGDLIEMDTRLYVAIQNIASGGQIVVGENVELTTIDKQLKYKDGRIDNLLTKHFLNNKVANLMDLAPEATAGNKRVIRLEGNAVYFDTASNASSHSGSTHYGFIISKTPKFITTKNIMSNSDTYFDDAGLTVDDFTAIPDNPGRQLIVTIDIDNELVEGNSYSDALSCVVGIATYNSNPTYDSQNPDETLPPTITTYWTDMNALPDQKFSKTVEINISKRLPQALVNGNLAVFFISPRPTTKGQAVVRFEYATSTSTGWLGQYWQDEIDTSINTINENIMNAGRESATVCFITDCHWAANMKKSPDIVKAVTDACNIDCFVFGGDMIEKRTFDGRIAAMKMLNAGFTAFREKNIRLPMITLYGNHDRNRDGIGEQNKSNPTMVLSREDHLRLTQLRSTYDFYGIQSLADTTDPNDIHYDDVLIWENDTYRFAAIYWYADHNSVKTVTWAEQLFDTSKQVIIFNHGIYFKANFNKSEDTIHEQWLLNTLEPYKNKIRCIIQGHSHRDAMRYAWGEVPIIIVDCDKAVTSISKYGTISEQSFAVITINSQEIKIVKVGRGSDKTITSSTPEYRYNYSTHTFTDVT